MTNPGWTESGQVSNMRGRAYREARQMRSQLNAILPFALIAPRSLAYRCGYGVEWSALHVFGGRL